MPKKPISRTPEELRAEIDRCEEAAQRARRQYQQAWLLSRAAALRWALGEETSD